MKATSSMRTLLWIAIVMLPASLAVAGQTRPATRPQSARIEQLRADLAAERSGALEEFWADLKQRTTPLFEPAADGKRTLVSFIWRGQPDTRNVIVNLDAEPVFKNLQLERLGDTDVWHRTYELASDAQFYYQFSINDSLVPFEEETDWGTRDKTFTADPLNPNGITIGGTRSFSFAVLPGAQMPDVYEERAGIPQGKFEPGGGKAFMIQSGTLGDQRIWIYSTPGLAETAGAVNLVLFVDGSGAWQLLPSTRMFDNLFADGKIGPTIAVYIDSPDRERDLACSDEYLAFLIDEVLPWIGEKHKADFKPQTTIISGRSLGGLFAGYAALRRPDVFGGAMMQSPSLWWGADKDGENEWLTRQFAEAPLVDARFYIAPGLFETATNSPTSISILSSSRHLRDVLKAKGYDFKYRDVAGGHDPLNWQVSLPEGLLYLLGKEP